MARESLEPTLDTAYHIFIHQKKTAWIAYCVEVTTASFRAPSQEAARARVYEEIKRVTGLNEIFVVEELVQRGTIDLANGRIHHAIH